MLPKPVTALALSAIVSLAPLSLCFAPSTAFAATSSDEVSAAGPRAHHGQSHAKKSSKKKAHLASIHGAEPKPGKVPASLQSHLDLKTVQDRQHGKKSTLAATGREVFIGGPTHAGRSGADRLSERPVVETVVSPATEHSAHGAHSAHGTHGKHGAMAKSGRAPSRGSAARTEDGESGSDDHPVPIALRGEAAKGAVRGPCLHEPVEVVRGGETERFALTRCDGATAPLAVERLSVLVRPESVTRVPSLTELSSVTGDRLAPGIRRVDPGLVRRVQAIVDHFADPAAHEPATPARVTIVSGYRPGSRGSFHATAQALDFHLEGVPNEAVVDFCKTLDDTGCGYYPNSSFVHVDVRPAGTGHVAWIDASGPGEDPRYVASWPPSPEPDVKIAREDAEDAAPDAEATPTVPSLPSLPERAHEKAPAVSITQPLRLKDWE